MLYWSDNCFTVAPESGLINALLFSSGVITASLFWTGVWTVTPFLFWSNDCLTVVRVWTDMFCSGVMTALQSGLITLSLHWSDNSLAVHWTDGCLVSHNMWKCKDWYYQIKKVGASQAPQTWSYFRYRFTHAHPAIMGTTLCSHCDMAIGLCEQKYEQMCYTSVHTYSGYSFILKASLCPTCYIVF